MGFRDEIKALKDEKTSLSDELDVLDVQYQRGFNDVNWDKLITELIVIRNMRAVNQIPPENLREELIKNHKEMLVTQIIKNPAKHILTPLFLKATQAKKFGLQNILLLCNKKVAWFYKTIHSPHKKTRKQKNEELRLQIYSLRTKKKTFRQIAKELDVHLATIYRLYKMGPY